MTKLTRRDQLLSLSSEAEFQRLTELINEISFFNVVGRTYTETWHSAFLGWLLNPTSNHGLGTFPLQRFLLAMVYRANPHTQSRHWSKQILLGGDLQSARSRPNEKDLAEVAFPRLKAQGVEGGRLDVFVNNIKLPSNSEFDDIQIFIEMKVNDPIDKAQCHKYRVEAERRKAEMKTLCLTVFVTPEWNLIKPPIELLGDEEWILIDFQSLYDEVIAPCVKHHLLSSFGGSMLREYVLTLRQRNFKKTGEPRMIISEEEQEIASLLLSKYGDAVKVLFEILNKDGSPDTSDENIVTPAKKVAKYDYVVDVTDRNGQHRQLKGNSMKSFYEDALKFLVEGNYLLDFPLPFATGSKRYLLALDPVHIFGNKFEKTATVLGQPYFMEANQSAEGGMNALINLLSELNIPIIRHSMVERS